MFDQRVFDMKDVSPIRPCQSHDPADLLLPGKWVYIEKHLCLLEWIRLSPAPRRSRRRELIRGKAMHVTGAYCSLHEHTLSMFCHQHAT